MSSIRRNCPSCQQNARSIRQNGTALMTVVTDLGNRMSKYMFDFCSKCGTVYCFAVDNTSEAPKLEIMGKEISSSVKI